MKLYALYTGDPDDTSKIWLALDKDKSKLNERHFKKGEPVIGKEVVFTIYQGSIWMDGTGSTGASKIINDRVLTALIDSGITGLESYPVTTLDGKSKRQDYHLIRAAAECDPIDKSQAKIKPSPINPGVMIKVGFGIDTSCITTDIIRPQGTTMLLCNEKVKDVIEALEPEVTGVRFQPIEEFRI